MLKLVHHYLTMFHIAFAFVTLFSFWFAVLTKKGGHIHKRFGKSFCVSMIFCCTSSYIMSILSITDPIGIHPGKLTTHLKNNLLLLNYLGTLSLVCCFNGYIAVKGMDTKYRKPANALLLIYALICLAFGVMEKNVVVMILSLIGIYLGYLHIMSFRKGTVYHLKGMIGGGIGLHTAFIVGGGVRYLPKFFLNLGWFGWVLPTLIGITISRYFETRYKEKLNFKS